MRGIDYCFFGYLQHQHNNCSDGLCPLEIFRFIHLKHQLKKYHDSFNHDTIAFRRKSFIQQVAQVNNILQCTKLPILGVTFQKNCKYREHVRAKLIKANKCLFVSRSLWKEGFSQGEVDHLFSALVLPNFTYGLPVYGAIDSDLTVIQNFMDKCFKKEIHI